MYDLLCGIGEPSPMPPWSDCINLPGYCPPSEDESVCLDVPAAGEGSPGVGGICSSDGCAVTDDCPAAPATGTASVACVDALGDGALHCVLDCAGGQTCPDGALCHPDLGLCYFETVFLEPYAACDGAYGVCPLDTCLSSLEGSACTATCTGLDDCPAEPSGTGDAPLACSDLGFDEMLCALDCSAGQTCPDGMVCHGFGMCLTPP
jgi:hypothetical protein